VGLIDRLRNSILNLFKSGFRASGSRFLFPASRENDLP
jgi:hypothetical protein